MLFAGPPGKPDITVMTQNQYLGADLTPIIAADGPEEYNLAVLEALFTVAANNAPERVQALADTILERSPHLVGLQEMFLFECIETASPWSDCSLFDAAMNDHLQLTEDALGSEYNVVGIVNNLDLPGLPVYLNDDLVPDVYIRVLDRDVILARSDVSATPVPFPCSDLLQTPSEDGCNYFMVAEATMPDGSPLRIQRGYVGVDTTIGDVDYRFVNTHLEVQYPAPEQDAPLIQAVQMSELIGMLLMTTPMPGGPTLIVAGDINSNPLTQPFLTSYGFLAYPPYQQLATGVTFQGDQLPLAFTDIWPLRPGKPRGLTCCEAGDLSNTASMLYERIDVIFTLQPPMRVKANVLNNDPEDKTPSGLWPSDHASMVGRLFY
jgi:endonuclease/exonuclease/phosphatase family metal-dependent hydrolase